MTLRCKTIEYAYVINNASLATATRLNFSAITLTIPEQTSLTFLSCEVDVTCEGGQTGGTATTARLIGISVNGVSFDDQTLTYTVSNSSNTQLSYHFSRDVTAHFNTNWPAATTTATCQVGLQFTGPTTINHCVKILLTYQFDDNGQTTRVKTVRIPLDAKNGGLTTSLANIGTNQIPNLSTFCPENSPTFLNMWVQFEGNNGALAGTNSTITFGLDLVSSITTQTSIHTQANNYWVRYLFDVSSMSTTASHNVSLQTSSANYAFPSASLVLYVTYTYNHSATTTVLNSLVMAISDGRQRPGIDSTNYTRYATSFSIPESTPTLVQSGILMYGGDITMTAWNMRAGAQTFTTHTFTSGQIGDVAETCVSFRVDSGGAGGTGITIASGACTVTVDTYSASPTDDDSVGSLVSPVLYLNYTSLLAAAGADAHNHTTMWTNRDALIPVSSDVDNQWTQNKPFAAPETTYYVSNWTFHPFYMIDFTSLGGTWLTFAQIFSTEPIPGGPPGITGPGWAPIQMATPVYIFSGTGVIEFPTNANAFYRQTPGDTTKLDPTKASRLWRSNQTNNTVISLGARMLATYHALTTALAGTLVGYAGDGSGVTVKAFSDTTNLFAGSAVTTTGGAYSITVPSGDTYFTTTQQDPSHVGRSQDGVAV